MPGWLQYQCRPKITQAEQRLTRAPKQRVAGCRIHTGQHSRKVVRDAIARLSQRLNSVQVFGIYCLKVTSKTQEASSEYVLVLRQHIFIIALERQSCAEGNPFVKALHSLYHQFLHKLKSYKEQSGMSQISIQVSGR